MFVFLGFRLGLRRDGFFFVFKDFVIGYKIMIRILVVVREVVLDGIDCFRKCGRG